MCPALLSVVRLPDAVKLLVGIQSFAQRQNFGLQNMVSLDHALLQTVRYSHLADPPIDLDPQSLALCAPHRPNGCMAQSTWITPYYASQQCDITGDIIRNTIKILTTSPCFCKSFLHPFHDGASRHDTGA